MKYATKVITVHFSGQCQTMFREGGGSVNQHFFANLLKTAASEGDMRDCPSNCGQRVQLKRTLTNLPDVGRSSLLACSYLYFFSIVSF